MLLFVTANRNSALGISQNNLSTSFNSDLPNNMTNGKVPHLRSAAYQPAPCQPY